jgi:hypothetical protein
VAVPVLESPVPVDPAGIRDIFRYAADPQAPDRRSPEELPASAPGEPATPPGPRLVGLVRRAGGLVAALAADGDVVLAGPGETVAGVTVVAVDEDGVLIRRADGSVATLVLP